MAGGAAVIGEPAGSASRRRRRGSRHRRACPASRSRPRRLRREGGLGIDARDDGLDGFRWRRVEVDARPLAHADASDLPLGDERPQVDLGQVHERDDRRAGHDHLARLGRSRGDGAGERRDDLEVLAVGPRLFELSAGALGVRLRGGDVRLGLEDLSLDGGDLRGANGRVDEIGPRRLKPAARRLDLTPRGRDQRRLGLLVALGPSRLLFRHQLFLVETRERLSVPLRQRMRGLGLGELGLGRGEPPLGLVDPTLGIRARLIDTEPALAKLLVQDGDLVLSQPHAGLGLADGGLRLRLTGADLLVIEHGDDFPGLDSISFPHGDLADPAGGLGGEGGIISLDPAAHADHAGCEVGRREKEAPGGEPADAEQDGQRDDRERASTGHARRLGRGP